MRPLPGDTRSRSGARRCTGGPGATGRSAGTPKGGEEKKNTHSSKKTSVW